MTYKCVQRNAVRRKTASTINPTHAIRAQERISICPGYATAPTATSMPGPMSTLATTSSQKSKQELQISDEILLLVPLWIDRWMDGCTTERLKIP